MVLLHKSEWFCPRAPAPLELCLLLFLDSSSCSVHCRVVHTLQREGDESFLVINCLVFCSFTDPVLIADPFSSQLVPDSPSIVPAPFVFPLCVVARVVFHSFLLAWIATLYFSI